VTFPSPPGKGKSGTLWFASLFTLEGTNFSIPFWLDKWLFKNYLFCLFPVLLTFKLSWFYLIPNKSLSFPWTKKQNKTNQQQWEKKTLNLVSASRYHPESFFSLITRFYRRQLHLLSSTLHHTFMTPPITTGPRHYHSTNQGSANVL
jgi:hypothetical protein